MRKAPRPLEKASNTAVPRTIVGYVSVTGRATLFDGKTAALGESTKPFHASAAKRKRVERELFRRGFDIIAGTPLGFAVAGTPEAFEELTGGKVRTREKRLRQGRRHTRYVTHVDIRGANQPRELGVGSPRSPRSEIDGIVLDRPRAPQAVSAVPPNVGGFYLDVPGDVAEALGALGAQQQGFSGQGVRVAMPDTGMFPHPYYAAQPYQILAPTSVLPDLPGDEDPIGHGTGECANVFAIAPRCEVQPIRCSDENGALVGGLAGIVAAKASGAQVISISFGGALGFPPSRRPPTEALALALELQHAVESGTVVVAAAGDGQFAIEPQVPGVIAAGGVYVDRHGRRQASDVASAFDSPWFPEVQVPLVCGLCGVFPDFYLMLPVPPNSELDLSQAGFPGEPNDGTDSDDGWARFSGTSAAAPQIAGAAAVLLSALPGLTPQQVAESLCETAIDITRGRCNPMFDLAAEPGRDGATGFGLINVTAALEFAQRHFA